MLTSWHKILIYWPYASNDGQTQSLCHPRLMAKVGSNPRHATPFISLPVHLVFMDALKSRYLSRCVVCSIQFDTVRFGLGHFFPPHPGVKQQSSTRQTSLTSCGSMVDRKTGNTQLHLRRARNSRECLRRPRWTSTVVHVCLCRMACSNFEESNNQIKWQW